MHWREGRTGVGGTGTTRRLAAATMAAALVAAVAGCGGDAPATGGGLTYAINQEPQCVDPHATGQSVTSSVARPVVDSLVWHDTASGELRPWLARSWSVSADQRSWTFVLRTGVTFSDGTPFDAAAVRANLDHIVDPRTKSLGAAGVIAPYYRDSQVVDGHTVTVRLKQPFASLLVQLSTVAFGMQSPTWLATGGTELCTTVVGSGPFVMRGGWRKGRGVDYVRNDAYDWAPQGAPHQGPARLDSLHIKLITQDSARIGALTSGQVDAAARVPALDVKRLEGTMRVLRAEAPGENYSLFPNTASPVFSDVRVRQAFRGGIDWDDLVQRLFFGAYRTAAGPLSPATRFVAPATTTAVPYDPERAGQLLDEAGWRGRDAEGYRTRDGKRLTVRFASVKAAETAENVTLSEQVQAEARKLGFDVQIVNLPISQVINNAQRGTYELMATGFSGPDADVLRKLFGSDGVAVPGRMGSNIAKYRNATLDRLLADAQLTTEEPRRAALYAQAQKQVVDDAAVIPVYAAGSLVATTRSVDGVVFDGEASPSFYAATRSR
ncbi:ABC transporter substrate-binding protein [Micromonospora wenchangensis]|uniref:ABC transporter substrate-binding protein n=1 Tax=Micromonospora wenchangensis TaxID=1185415 RepID=UPI003D739AF0